MTIMMHSDYERGVDAANRALDRTGATAREMLAQVRAAEDMHRRQENHALAEWAKGYGDTVQEFLDDQGQ